MNHACPGCTVCLICGALPELSRLLTASLHVIDEKFNIERVADLAAKLTISSDQFAKTSGLTSREALAAVIAVAAHIAEHRMLDDETRQQFAQLADELSPLIAHYLSRTHDKHQVTIH